MLEAPLHVLWGDHLLPWLLADMASSPAYLTLLSPVIGQITAHGCA